MSKKIEKKEKKSKLKLFLIGSGIFILFLFLIGYFLLIGPSEKVKYALIKNINGNVEIQTDEINWIKAENEQKLEENQKIRTNNGNVMLNFNNGILINLKSETEMEFKEIVNNEIKLKQTSGTTWTKFINVLGIETYEIETPNSVAIVRGTEFKLELNGTTTILLTTDGNVSFKDNNYNNGIFVSKYKKAQNIDNNVEFIKLTIKDKKEIIETKKIILNQVKDVRLEEIYKNEFILNQIKNMYDLDDIKILELLKKIDSGQVDLDEYINNIPFKIKNIDKIIKYNKEIKILNEDIEYIENDIKTYENNN